MIKSPEEIEIMRYAGKILQAAQRGVKELCRPGMILKELDKVAEDIIREHRALPGFKGYKGFPATLCTMINSEVVHGIPDNRKLKEGDLFSVDCGVIWKGFYSDAAFSLIIGGDNLNPERARFSNCVRDALLAGCKAAKAGNYVGDIGYTVEHIIKKGGYSICKQYTGHGLGKELWEEPSIFNYGKPKTGKKLEAGMTIAIEPIVTKGNPKTKVLKDGWTVVTVDGRDACQWEHCGVVTEKGLEIFA